MTDLKKAAQQALEALENVTKDYVESRQYKHNKAITALRTAIEQAETQEPNYYGLTNDHLWMSVSKEQYGKLKPAFRMACYTTPPAQPAQEPSSWVETVAVNLVREGINKHKARELAAHFHGLAQQPAAQRQPLTDEEIMQTWEGVIKYAPGEVRLKDFARAIEAAHGIKEKNT